MIGIWQTLLVALVPGLFISVVTAYLASWWTARRYCSQRWWDLKAEAYSKLIANLATMEYTLGQWSDVWVTNRDLPADASAKLSEEQRRCRQHVEVAAAVGSFVISRESAQALGRLLRQVHQLEGSADVVGMLDSQAAAVQECTTVIREQAERDLRRLRP